MKLRLRCEQADCGRWSEHDVGAKPPPFAACRHCGTGAALRPDVWLLDGRVQFCPRCGGREFFVRKDFPQRLGMGIVVAAGSIAMILMLWGKYTLWGYGLLAAVVLVDAVVYFFVGRVTVCYRCRSEVRDFEDNPDHGAYDLATDEKYAPASPE